MQQIHDLINRVYRIEAEMRLRLSSEDGMKRLTVDEFLPERKLRAAAQMARIELLLDEPAMAVAPR